MLILVPVPFAKPLLHLAILVILVVPGRRLRRCPFRLQTNQGKRAIASATGQKVIRRRDSCTFERPFF